MAPIAFSSSSSDESLQQQAAAAATGSVAHRPVAWIGQVRSAELLLCYVLMPKIFSVVIGEKARITTYKRHETKQWNNKKKEPSTVQSNGHNKRTYDRKSVSFLEKKDYVIQCRRS